MNQKTPPFVSRSWVNRILLVLVTAMAGGGMAGCSLTKPTADPTRFFVLSSREATGGSFNREAPAVHVRPVELASYIRSRPLIVRKNPNEVEFRDFARWGEPLDQGIARVLREDLLASGAASTVMISGVRAANRPYDFEVSIRLLACEGTTDGAVVFRAIWEVSVPGDKSAAPAARGDFRPTDVKWDGKTDTSLVAGISEAVSSLAAQIGAALRK